MIPSLVMFIQCFLRVPKRVFFQPFLPCPRKPKEDPLKRWVFNAKGSTATAATNATNWCFVELLASSDDGGRNITQGAWNFRVFFTHLGGGWNKSLWDDFWPNWKIFPHFPGVIFFQMFETGPSHGIFCIFPICSSESELICSYMQLLHLCTYKKKTHISKYTLPKF